jgi:hypothetical protein
LGVLGSLPAAVQIVARDTIQGAGPQVNLSELLVRVPGLTILDRQNYAQDVIALHARFFQDGGKDYL